MHEFILSGELKAQTKRLLRYRIPLVLVIILNIVVLARIPMPPTEAQALGPAVSLAPSNGRLAEQTQTDPLGIAKLTRDVPGATPFLVLPTPGENTSQFAFPVFQSPIGSDAADSSIVPAYPMPLPTNGPAEWYAPNTHHPDVAPKTVAADTLAATLAENLSSIPLDQWQRDTEQLVARWQHSAHNVMQRFTDSWYGDSWYGDSWYGDSWYGDSWYGDSREPNSGDAPAVEPHEVITEPGSNPGRLSDLDPAATRGDTGLAIRNPPANEETVRFLVNSRLCELRPGEAHWFAPEDQWLIQFHRGGEYGDVDRVVSKGSYQFTATPQGWDIRPVKQ